MTVGLLHCVVVRAAYTLSEDLMSSFFDQFEFFTSNDPTQGYVNYVDRDTAASAGHTRVNDDGSVYIGVDYNRIASGRGRDSVRLFSKNIYNKTLMIVDIAHMPGGFCGTCAPDCFLSPTTKYLLQSTTQNCDATVDNNTGCSFHDTDSKSFGVGFNENGGGIYAMLWDPTGVNMWFFSRGTEPPDILSSEPSPKNWHYPSSTWSGDNCDWNDRFKDHNLVLDTTFYREWAANTFDSCSAANGGQTCKEFVKNNPAEFAVAYWQINAFKIYLDNDNNLEEEPLGSSSAVDPVHVTRQPPLDTSVPSPKVSLPTKHAGSVSWPVGSDLDSDGEVVATPDTTSTTLQTTKSEKPHTIALDTIAIQTQSIDFVEQRPDGQIYDEIDKRSFTQCVARRRR